MKNTFITQDVFTSFLDHNQMVKDLNPNTMVYMRSNCTEYYLFGHGRFYYHFKFNCGVLVYTESFFSDNGVTDFLSKFHHPYAVDEFYIINA